MSQDTHFTLLSSLNILNFYCGFITLIWIKFTVYVSLIYLVILSHTNPSFVKLTMLTSHPCKISTLKCKCDASTHLPFNDCVLHTHVHVHCFQLISTILTYMFQLFLLSPVTHWIKVRVITVILPLSDKHVLYIYMCRPNRLQHYILFIYP